MMNPAARSRDISSPVIKTTEELFYWLQIWIYIKVVLSEFPRDAWHVRRFPCKDVSILMEEHDAHAFLFIRQLHTKDELRIGIKSRLFQDRRISRVYLLL